RSNSLAITALFLETHKGCGAFCHAPLPGVLSSQRRYPPMILLEYYRSYSEIFGLFWRQPSALGTDHRSDLLEAVLAHGLSQNGVRLAERINPVDQVNIQFSNIHRELSDSLDQRRAARCGTRVRAPLQI